MCWNSRDRAWREISASAPASSTPVGSAADDDEGQPLAAVLGIALGHLVGEQHAAADLERVLDALEAGREGRPLVVAEVGVGRAGGEDEVVVGELAVGQDELLRGEVDADRLRQHDRDVPSRRGTRSGSAPRCRRGSGPRWPPGRGAAGRGGGCAGRRSSRAPAAPRSARAAYSPPKPPPTMTTSGRLALTARDRQWPASPPTGTYIARQGPLADHPRRVPGTGCVLHQAGIAGPESPERAVAEADLELPPQDDDPLAPGRRVPVLKVAGRRLAEPGRGGRPRRLEAPGARRASAPRCARRPSSPVYRR